MSNKSKKVQNSGAKLPRSTGGDRIEQPRKMVGNYILGKTIGEGTFGKVKIAVHIPTGEKVAVKVLEKSRIKEQADIRRVNREIKILKKNKHPNIIQLYEVLDTQNSVYLIMENADGGEMFDFIVAHKHLPEKLACTFFHQIVDGVEILHKNDITHRDLKPENLLLKATANGWLVKIVDFGLSNTHEGGRLLSTACGSPCYAPPEMIAGKKYCGPLADIWSMGVILFALVCGYLPFEDPNTSALYKKILSGEHKPAKWISVDVKSLIRKILEVDPTKRYTLSDIRKHTWYSLVDEASIPKDIISTNDIDIARDEALQGITDAGIDTQLVLDGIASKACNSLTATYYLLEQRAKKKRMKLRELQEKNPIQQNHANNSIATASANINNKSNKENNNLPTDTQTQSNAPRPLPVINHNIKVTVPQGIPSSVNDASSSTTTSQKPPSGRLVPKLNINEAMRNNNLIINKPPSMISQTARDNPSTTVKKEINPPIVSQSARTSDEIVNTTNKLNALGLTDATHQEATVSIPGDIPDRPATRRSRLRSRTGATAGEDNLFAPAGFDESDKLYNVPITITNDGGAEASPIIKFPPQIKNQTPQAPKPSSAGTSGRRGKNIVVATNT